MPSLRSNMRPAPAASPRPQAIQAPEIHNTVTAPTPMIAAARPAAPISAGTCSGADLAAWIASTGRKIPMPIAAAMATR